MPRIKLLVFAQSLRVFTALQLGQILFAHNPDRFSIGGLRSARNQSQKWCRQEVIAGDLEKIKGGYRVKGCKSEGKEHSLKLSDRFVELYKIPSIQPVVHREKFINEINRQPDALILLKRNGKGACLILEEVNTETERYLQSKVNDWNSWDKATQYLSELFQYKIPFFNIVIAGTKDIPRGCYSFENYLKEVKKDG